MSVVGTAAAFSYIKKYYGESDLSFINQYT